MQAVPKPTKNKNKKKSAVPPNQKKFSQQNIVQNSINSMISNNATNLNFNINISIS